MNLSSTLSTRLNHAIREVYTEIDHLDGLLKKIHRRLVDVGVTLGTNYEGIVDSVLGHACKYRWIESFVKKALEDRPQDDDLRKVGAEVLAEVAKWKARAPDAFSKADQDKFVNFMVVSFKSTADVDEALKRVGYSHEGMWLPNLSPKENYGKLIDSASEDGWDPLLAFVLLCDRWTRPEVPQLTEELLHRIGVGGFRVFDTLNQIKLKDETVAEFYHDSLTEHSFRPLLPKGARETPVYVAYAIAAAQDAMLTSPDANAHMPLRNFLELVAGIDAAAEQKVAGLWRVMSDTWKLPAQLIARREGEAETHSVVVELQESSAWTRERPSWNRRAWLYHQRSEKRSRLDDHLEDTPETLASMPAYLNALRDKLATWRIGPGGILFEVFLPLRSLTYAIDQWKVMLDGELDIEFGFENPVVLRAERDRKIRHKVEARWEQLRKATSLTGYLTRKSRGGNLRDLYKEFASAKGLLGLVLESHLGPDRDAAVDFPCVGAAITAGLPIIIWAREETAAQCLGTEIAKWSGTPPCRLPATVHHIRQNDTVLGPHLTLFFENAGHWLPDDTQAMEART